MVPFITKDNASALGKKGAAATAEKWKQAQSRSYLAPVVVVTDAVTDSYVLKRLARVRKQIDHLSSLMEAETNPQAVDRYSAAIDRLSKLEGYYANRPGPGNRKPAPDRPTKRQLAPAPQPVVEDQPSTSSRDEPNG